MDNGELFSYTIDPSKPICSQLMEMVDLYMQLQTTRTLEEIFVTPRIMSTLNKETYSQAVSGGTFGAGTLGWSDIRLSTMTCTVKVTMKRQMLWQVFVGTQKEYDNNDFNTLLGRALSV